MDFLMSQTRKNLARSFAGESQARTRYTVYAGIARKENNEWIARIWEEAADNEAVHAEEFLEMMQSLGGCAVNIAIEAGYPFQLGTTLENLASSAEAERNEHDADYPAFAEIAQGEGFDDAARLWLHIARIEGVHYNTFHSLETRLREGTLFAPKEPILWRCLNCGFVYENTRALDTCPVCGKSASWQEGTLNRKNIRKNK